MEDTDPQALLRMDPATRRARLGSRWAGRSRHARPGAMWVGLTQTAVRLLRIDPPTNRVVARLRPRDVPGG